MSYVSADETIIQLTSQPELESALAQLKTELKSDTAQAKSEI